VYGSQALTLIEGSFLLLRVDGAGTVTHAECAGSTPFEIDTRGAAGRPASAVLEHAPDLLRRVRDALAGHPSIGRIEDSGRPIATRVDPVCDDGVVTGCSLLVLDASGLVDELACTEAKLAEAQRLAHVGSWEWDASRNSVTWTDELYRIYGLEKADFGHTYESFLEHVHPDDRAYTSGVIFDAFRAVKPFIYDHRVVRKDGAVRMLHTRGDVVADKSGKPIRLLGCCWDVTELWEAQRRAERALALLRATLDSTEDGIFAVDLDGKIVDMNARALELWQIPPDVAASRDTWALIDHVRDMLTDPEEFIAREKAIICDRENIITQTTRFKDGRVFERYSMPERLKGDVIGRVCSFRDVTERERQLARALLLSDASRILTSIDVERALGGVARIALPFLGTASAVDLFTEAGGPRRVASITLPGALPVDAEMAKTVLAGRSFLQDCGGRSCLSVPIVVRGELAGVFTFMAPRTRRYTPPDVQLAEEVARRAAAAIDNDRLSRSWREALAARDEFLSVASHELRGPIASMHLAVQQLLSEGSSERSHRLVGVIERADRRLGRFVEQLLEATQVRAGRIRFALDDVDLGDVVRQVVTGASQDLVRSGSKLSTSHRGALIGRWDRARLARVVECLLSNAIKFGLGRPIELLLEGDEEKVRLEVVDHGTGIVPERREAIFQPFERAVSARHYGGLGLGLYIARAIVEGLGGKLELRSEVDRGSTFIVELPKEARWS
jgi:PAS domain S-box-containing protein